MRTSHPHPFRGGPTSPVPALRSRTLESGGIHRSTRPMHWSYSSLHPQYRDAGASAWLLPPCLATVKAADEGGEELTRPPPPPPPPPRVKGRRLLDAVAAADAPPSKLQQQLSPPLDGSVEDQATARSQSETAALAGTARGRAGITAEEEEEDELQDAGRVPEEDIRRHQAGVESAPEDVLAEALQLLQVLLDQLTAALPPQNEVGNWGSGPEATAATVSDTDSQTLAASIVPKVRLSCNIYVGMHTSLFSFL